MSPPVTKDALMRAILSLDVYHRGYNQGVRDDASAPDLGVAAPQVGQWELGPGKTIIRLPRNPPPVELPLGDRTKKPTIYFVPPQTVGPPDAWLVGPSSIAKAANRDIKLLSLTMEQTREPLTEWLDPAPVWMAAFRGGEKRSIEVHTRSPHYKTYNTTRENPEFRLVARTDLETSKKG